MRKSFGLAAALSLLLATSALAGEQYVDPNDFAVSGYDVVAYFDLPQSDIGQPRAPAVPGLANITADYNGATFAFATEANRDRFLADPASFVPQFDGHCAYGAAKGGKVPGNPDLWRIVDGKLYLNITRNVAGLWEQDVQGNISLASNNWSGGLEDAPASHDAIPEFTSAAPVK